MKIRHYGQRDAVQIGFDQEVERERSRTKQSFQEDCNINAIMARWEKTGVIEHVNKRQGRYGDFSAVYDYQSAQDAITDANEAFMGLSASLRSRFDNDPGKLLAFLDDPDNRAEAQALGLIVSQEESASPPEEAVKKEDAADQAESRETDPILDT